MISLKHPFNEELGFIAKRFGALLRDIVETVDRYGLKRYHLRKHQRPAEQFLNEIVRLESGNRSRPGTEKEDREEQRKAIYLPRLRRRAMEQQQCRTCGSSLYSFCGM